MEYPYIHLSNIRTSVSLIDARYLQTTYKKPVFYIPNGIEEPSSIDHTKVPAMLSECGVDPGDYILFAAGRMVPLKGCHLLLEAYRGLQCYPKLLVVGDLSHVPDYEDRLRRLADARVTFIPLVTDKAVLYGLLRHCRLFVFPSTDEAMSMMLLEAISMGAPVLCSDIPQNTILCKDMLFFKSGDVQDLKEKLSWAIDHMEIMRTQANNARIAVTQLYRWNHIVAEYEHLYAATINPGLAMSTVPSIDRHSTFNDKTAHNLHRIN
jgi:glycosyltransferase involved in cell wall biosynthesis